MNCLRCNGKMFFVGTEKIQLGRVGLLTGVWSNIVAGAIEVKIYICSECRKIEFFDNNYDNSNLPQKTCPKCGDIHDFDYPKCPSCKYQY